jgi:hypothetical protein
MTTAKHIHRLKKHRYKSGVSVFFCTLTDCNYKIEVPFSLGKESLCNICNEIFIMNEYTLKLVKPHCNNCGRREVKDSNGVKHYIRKINTNVLLDIASDETASLKDRLKNVTIIQTAQPDEEI